MLESLTVDERVTVLARLERSRFAELSLAFIGWRTVMIFVVYEHPAELEAIGYASDERKVYKRRLALDDAAPCRSPMAPPPRRVRRASARRCRRGLRAPARRRGRA